MTHNVVEILCAWWLAEDVQLLCDKQMALVDAQVMQLCTN